jgi:pyruvate dehydrogenase (quinone)
VTVLRALLPRMSRKTDRTFLETAQQRMAEWNTLMERRGTRSDRPMKPQVVAHGLNAFLRDDAIVSADSGTIATWAARHIRIRAEMQFSLSGTLATMANALPYSIGAAVAFPGRQIVAIVGDGGFTMLMGEVATLVKYQLPVKVIVFKNNLLGMIKWEQMALEGTPQYGVELEPIDFAGVARACGAGGFTVSDPKELHGVLQQAFEYPGPAVVEAVIDPDEPPLPGHITTKQALRFAQAIIKGKDWDVLKTVARDRAREVI